MEEIFTVPNYIEDGNCVRVNSERPIVMMGPCGCPVCVAGVGLGGYILTSVSQLFICKLVREGACPVDSGPSSLLRNLRREAEE